MPSLSRRSFLGLAAAFVLDPERLLWVPGAKHISIPAPVSVVPDLWVQLGQPSWRRISTDEWFAILESADHTIQSLSGTARGDRMMAINQWK